MFLVLPKEQVRMPPSRVGTWPLNQQLAARSVGDLLGASVMSGVRTEHAQKKTGRFYFWPNL